MPKQRPEKKLLGPLKKRAGRNRAGRITVRHRGGGAKRKYRLIDFGQRRLGQGAKVLRLEYDPNRTCQIALIEYKGGQKAYILAPDKLKPGDSIEVAEKAALKPGNRMRLKNIAIGAMVYNVEMQPNKGGKIARSAGNSVEVMGHEGKHALLKMPSSEIRKVPVDCFASIGRLSNVEHRFEKLGKAGRARRKGVRPTVRGSAMNPVDHPHGGGEGRAPIGLKHPKTKWGRPARGVKTRKKRKQSDKLIVKRRRAKK